MIYQDLEDLIVSCSEGSLGIDTFDTSCFSGEYITGDVTEEYLSMLEAKRNDAAKLERENGNNGEPVDVDSIEFHNEN